MSVRLTSVRMYAAYHAMFTCIKSVHLVEMPPCFWGLKIRGSGNRKVFHCQIKRFHEIALL